MEIDVGGIPLEIMAVFCVRFYQGNLWVFLFLFFYNAGDQTALSMPGVYH